MTYKNIIIKNVTQIINFIHRADGQAGRALSIVF